MKHPRAAFRRLAFSGIALAFLTAGIATSFHSHKLEARDADHCITCQAAQQIRTGDVSVSVSSGTPPLAVSSLQHDSVAGCLGSFSLASHSRAPPFFA